MPDVEKNRRKPNHRALIIARWPVGGINTYLRYVYGNSTFDDYQFDILVPDIDDVDVLKRELVSCNIIVSKGGVKEFYINVVKHILFGKYDFVHSHGFTAGLVSAIPSKLVFVKHFITAHEVFTRAQFIGRFGRIKQSLVGWLLSLADVLQPVSEGAKENIVEYLPVLRKRHGCKLEVILNGIDSKRFLVGSTRDLHSELGLSDDVFLIGFMGRFMSAKGFKYLVLALQKILENPALVGRVKLVAIGSGGFIREDTQWVKDIGLADDVFFLPKTTEVAETLRGFDVLVVPSLWEACGLLAMEALVTGIPVIGSNCNGLQEVLEGTPATSVPPKDVHALAEAIHSYIDLDQTSKFVEYAPIAANRFDVGRVALKLRELYERK